MLPTPQRIALINALLFIVVLTLAVLLITRERPLPGRPPVEQVREEVAELIEQRGTARDRLEGQLQALGERRIFATIIPMPTPTPTPTPTPVPPPRIEEVTDRWRLEIILPRSGMAIFEDIGSRETWQLRPGESRTVDHRGRQVPVYLDSVDTSQFSATIRIDVDGSRQTRTFRVFN